MAGRGPDPKDPSTRARRNTKSTKTALTKRALRSVDELTDLTVAELRGMIDDLNASRPDDQQIDTRGKKSLLAERIIAAESPVPPMPDAPPLVEYDEDKVRHTHDVDWHEQTVSWWNDVWTSPMVSAWDDSDVHNVYVIALLYNDIWYAGSPKERKDALAEFRQQCARVGLDPVSRARLQWTIEGADEAKARGDKRRQSSGQPGSQSPRPSGVDPRHGLTSVK